MPKETPQSMVVAGTSVTVHFPDNHTETLTSGKIVRLYFNNAQGQLVAYLGQGVVGSGDTFNVTLGVCDGVPSPCGQKPSAGWPVKMEIAFDGVGEYWTQVVPTSDENQVGIVWTVDQFYNVVSVQV